MKTAAILLLLNLVTSTKLNQKSPDNFDEFWDDPEYRMTSGDRPMQLAPHGGIVPIRRTVDTYPLIH